MNSRRIRKRWRYYKTRQCKIMKHMQWRHRHRSVKRHKLNSKEFISSERILRYLKGKKFLESDSLLNNFKTDIIRSNYKNNCKVVVPRVFSFIKNPEETIKTLRKLVSYGQNKKTKSIFIDHSKCEELGICASAVMDTLILSIKNKRKNDKKFYFRGHTSSNIKVNEILVASGLIHHLHIHEVKIKDVECLELLHNDSSSEMTQRIIEYISRCLNSQGFILNRRGCKDMGEMISEVIDNCQQHSDFYEWFALGHYSKDNQTTGKVRLVIFNYGKTIYESFRDKGSQESMYISLKEKACSIIKKSNNIIKI